LAAVGKPRRMGMIHPQGSLLDVERGDRLMPRFDENGLVPAVAVDADSGAALMLAWMNEEALRRTLETGEAHYWSRSRQTLWRKGETSGQVQRLVELRVDCDQDALLLRVRPQGDGGCCHVGFPTCFYRRAEIEGARVRLVQD
jgi:phosphoribosyl-AMP cyclohydrolase